MSVTDVKMADMDYASTPDLRPGLKQYAWTEDDGLMRRYIYAFDETLEYRMRLYDFRVNDMNDMKSCPCCAFGLPPLCCFSPVCNMIEGTPAHTCKKMRRDIYYENEIEDIYSRRVGITRDGVVFKQLKQEPVTLNPMNPCAVWMCDYGRYPENGAMSPTTVLENRC